MNDNDFVSLFQTRAALNGSYKGRIDGSAGPATLAALDAVLPAVRAPDGAADKPAPDRIPGPAVGPGTAVFLPRDAAQDDIPDAGDVRLEDVHPHLVEVIKEASARLAAPFTVIEGVRTLARQKELYARGASKTMNSLHLKQPSGYAHASDLWPLSASGTPLPSGSKEREAVLWERLREIAAMMKLVAKEKGIMLEWGGDWGWDAPHFQLKRAAYPN